MNFDTESRENVTLSFPLRSFTSTLPSLNPFSPTVTRSGQPMSNYITPEKLTPLQKSMLKDTFQTIERAQSFVDQRFRTAVWTQMGR